MGAGLVVLPHGGVGEDLLCKALDGVSRYVSGLKPRERGEGFSYGIPFSSFTGSVDASAETTRGIPVHRPLCPVNTCLGSSTSPVLCGSFSVNRPLASSWRLLPSFGIPSSSLLVLWTLDMAGFLGFGFPLCQDSYAVFNSSGPNLFGGGGIPLPLEFLDSRINTNLLLGLL